MGILGVLLNHNGHITAVKPEIQTLRVKARFFLSEALEAAILSGRGVNLPLYCSMLTRRRTYRAFLLRDSTATEAVGNC